MRDLLPQMERLPWQYAVPVTVLMLSFVVLVVWVLRRTESEKLKAIAEIPLRDGDNEL